MSVRTVSSQADAANPLGYEKEGKLLVGFAIPCIISMLVTSLYNIVDQIFIGQGVGLLGNAATNIAFPLSIACTAIALLLGIGSATNFSLQLGAGNEKRSAEYAGNGLCLMALFGTVLMAVTLLFLTPMLKFFGATPDVLPYAEAYTRITALGFPFLIMNTGMSKLILADGSPRYSMMSMLIGALINTALDPLFIFGLDMGMTGAALATILGQIVSFCISIRYLFHFKSVPFSRGCFTIDGDRTRKIFSYGASACFNQIAMGVVQIVLNNTLAHYGALSIYGSDIPLACAGIISKVNMIFMAFVIGIFAGRTADHRRQLRCCALPPRQKELSAGAGCGYRAFSGSVCLLPAFPAADHQYFRHRQRDVLPVFGAVFPHLYVPDADQRHPAGHLQLLQLDWQGTPRRIHVPDTPDFVPAAAHRHLPALYGH